MRFLLTDAERNLATSPKRGFQRVYFVKKVMLHIARLKTLCEDHDMCVRSVRSRTISPNALHPRYGRKALIVEDDYHKADRSIT